MRIRGRVIKNFNSGKTIKKYFHIQTVFMIIMTCMLGRVIYENDRIEYTLEDIQSLLLKPAVAADTEKTQQHGIIESAYERNVAGSSDVMEKHMNEMQSGEVRYVNGYRIRKIRGSSDTSRTRPVEVNPYDGYKIVR